jgi:predicted Zn finger-like uncharacterized protein
MYTQCPECRTIYRIDEDALQASLGIVRCGRCDKRFDALRTLSDTLPVEPLEQLPEQDPDDRAPKLTHVVPSSAFEQAAGKSRSGKAAATPEPEPQAVPLTGDSSEDWFADIESELTAESRTADDPMAEPGDDTWSVELPGETDDAPAAMEAAATPVEEPWTVPETASPSAAGDAAPRETPVPEVPVSDVPVPGSGPDDVAVAFDEPAEGESMPAADTPLETAPADAGPEAAPVPVYVRPRRRFSRAGAMWTLGCVLLALLLAAQLAWADRVELFRNPATRAWMARICHTVPCSLPLIKDTAKLELLSRDVRPDPNAAGALTITATVRNNAAFSQPWPVVSVELSDLDNNPVAMRRFRPSEYMTDPARRAAGIAPGATAVVAFEVADPGRRAVAFQFGFE